LVISGAFLTKQERGDSCADDAGAYMAIVYLEERKIAEKSTGVFYQAAYVVANSTDDH